jgi:M3 family oligoendopeptidase
MTVPSVSFPEMSYSHPDFSAIREEFYAALTQFKDAPSAEAQIEAMEAINAVRGRLATLYNLVHIRHSIDARDEFYDQENNYFDEHMPQTEAWRNDYYRALLDSPHREALTTHFGPQLFRIAEASLRTFDPKILPLLQEENKLVTEYMKLKAKANFELDGEVYNLSNILVKELDPDRTTRRRAAEVKWAFYAENGAEMDRIYDELVRVRTRMAHELGYDNYIGLGYDRMLRTDYGPEEVARYREQVLEEIVPIAQELYARQRERLGLDQLKYYDEEFRFPDGNPKPQGDPDWIVEQARRMYEELSEETGMFFDFMERRKLMDLVAKDGKQPGGYCTYIPDYGTPFIFSNFNGTSGDIDVLTHEFGHAFQVYSSRDIGISEYNWPTYEACEIHSMSMEFFTWPWMQLFFGEETEKYRLAHLGGAVRFLPYGVAVDEFQHRIYAEPDLSPAERRSVWREIERKYLPQRDYDGHEYLESGGFWHKQNHIFAAPFYYIDYCLAQVCAFQFWQRDRDDHEAAWTDYLELCRAGGSGSFLELVQLAGLQSPFEAGVIAQAVQPIKDFLAEH